MAILGLRGTGNFATNEAPENWREGILFYYPNGETPLMALASQGKSEATDHNKFHWWDKALPTRRVYINNGSGYTATSVTLTIDDGSSGTATTHFHSGVVALNTRTFERMLVTGTGADTITVERGKGTTAAAAMVDNDSLLIIGTALEDGATAVTGLSYDPTERVNTTQIFARGVGPITRRMAKTTLRTGDKLLDLKHDAWLNIMLDLEWSSLFGDYLDEAGSSSAVRRTFSGGLQYFATTNVFDAGGTITYFEFMDALEDFFRYGASEKLVLAGSTFVNVLNKLAKLEMTMNTVPGEESFGMKITEILSPFGTLYLKMHPLLSDDSVFRSWGFVVDLQNFATRFIDDVTYIEHAVTDNPHRRQDEYYADLGWEWQLEKSHGIMKNLGSVA